MDGQAEDARAPQASDSCENGSKLERLPVETGIVEEAPPSLETIQQIVLGRRYSSLFKSETWVGPR
jgi:hypothetical protein